MSVEEEEEGLYNLFVCEVYVEKSWTFGDLQQRLLCSNMSSTDHDLTGQIVWPACILLSWFIYGNRELFRDKNVVELGAGCGLGGFVAANYCKQSIITDGNDIVIKLLNQNKDHLQSDNVDVAKLMWGLKPDVDQVYGRDESRYPDIIVGADVILWPNQIISLLYTIRWLLAFKPTSSKCYISYIVRAKSTTERLYATAQQVGLLIEDVDIASFLPAEVSFGDHTEKHLFAMSVDPAVAFDPHSEAIKEYARNVATESNAC